jgi:hypothetical protein
LSKERPTEPFRVRRGGICGGTMLIRIGVNAVEVLRVTL